MRAVITEAELRNFPAGCEIMVPRGVIVTPAARDYTAEHGIALVEIDEQDWDSAGSVVATHGAATAAPGRATVHSGVRTEGALPCRERLQTEIPLEELIVRIARAAVARLGRDPDRDVLVSVIATVLVRLGYAVAVAKGGEPKWPWKRWE
ncbi:MAG: hypothetical protein AB1700_03570 [Bacillota bacterium]